MLALLWRNISSLVTRYSPRMITSECFNGKTPAAAVNTLKVRPSLSQFLLLRRVRYTGTALATISLFMLGFRNYDSLLSLETLKSGYGAVSSATSNRPPDSALLTHGESYIDWSKFAYTQYVTNMDYLCNSVMIFETLYRLGSKPDRAMMYPEEMMHPNATEGKTDEAKLLIKARDVYGVKLHPIVIQRRTGLDCMFDPTTTDCPVADASSPSDMGRIVHKAPCLQSNAIQASIEHRLGFHCTTKNGRAVPHASVPRCDA